LGLLTSLRELRVANNRLDNLPIEIGQLKHLQILIASNNRFVPELIIFGLQYLICFVILLHIYNHN